MQEYRVVKRFDSWTGILNYLISVEKDAVLTETEYRSEFFYDDETDEYKVYIIMGKSKV